MAINWMKKGADSANVAKEEKQAAEKRRAEKGKMFRFFLKATEEAEITFIDGDLSPEGFLLPPRFYEHNLKLNGAWGNLFVCPEKTAPGIEEHKCPICEMGDTPYLAALFTIIDHRSFTGKENKIYVNTRKLLVVKPQSMEMLSKIASKIGGLAGQRFSVSRTASDKAPAIGDIWIPLTKSPISELKKLYTTDNIDSKTNIKSTVTYFEHAEYEGHEVMFKTGIQLRQEGWGKPNVGMSGFDEPKAASSTMADNL